MVIPIFLIRNVLILNLVLVLVSHFNIPFYMTILGFIIRNVLVLVLVSVSYFLFCFSVITFFSFSFSIWNCG